VIVLTSPIQAAAEEIFFRGYLLQALGSLVARPWFGVIASSVVFALLHGTQNVPLFVDRLAFGLLAGLLVWRTGGPGGWHCGARDQQCVCLPDRGLTTTRCSAQSDQGIGWVDARVRCWGLRALCRAGVCALARHEAADPASRSAEGLSVARQSRSVWGGCGLQ
jgi:hypothetical protein